MSYEQGNAHKIPAMASKSCNAVSPRELYVPLEYSVTTDTTNRTFEVVINAYCYFGTRINIENIFHDMTINGQSVANKTINGWVSADLPGKQIATLTINGTYNAEGKPSVKDFTVPLYGSMTYYKDVGCTETKELPFSNSVSFSIEDIEPAYTTPDTPTIEETTSLDDAILIDVQTTSFGEGGGKHLFVEYSKGSGFTPFKTSTEISTLSGTVRMSNLQKNTEYHIRPVAANDGLRATGVSQNVVTLAASDISKITPQTNGAQIEAIVYAGGGKYSPSTQVQISTDGGTNWSNVGSASANTHFTVTASSLTAGDTVLFRTQTTTTAGVYTSESVEYTVAGNLYGYVTNITPRNGTQADVTFYANSTSASPIQVTVYYRPYGMEEEWKPFSSVTTISRDTTATITLSDLIPNYAEYEVSLNIKQGSNEYDTDAVQFFTIPTMVHNDTCDSLDYLVQLICQTLEAIKRGNINLYMNDDTKKWCEGEDGIPTVASIMSRVNRFMHAVGCVLCSMDGFIELLKEADSNQVFMGKMGWVDCEDEVIEGSVNPVLSGAIYEAVDELIKQVWHYAGTYDYFARNLLELNAQSGTASGQKAVLLDKVYTWDGSSWGSPVDLEVENFGVIHINAGRYKDMAFYWFVNDWNRLDLDPSEIEDRLAALESLTFVNTFDNKNYLLYTAPYEYTDAEIDALVPTDATKDSVILLVEDMNENADITVIEDSSQVTPGSSGGVSGYGELVYYTNTQRTQTTSITLESQADVDALGGLTKSGSAVLTNGTIPSNLIAGVTLTNSVTSLPDSFLSNCRYLTSVNIYNANLTTIPYRFLYSAGSSSGGVTLYPFPSSVTTIGDQCFRSMSFANTSPMILPSNLTTLGSGFASYSGINVPIVFPSSLTAIGNSFLSDTSKFDQPIVIPDTITSIGDSFLFNAMKFNSTITLPDTLTSIGRNFLTNCKLFNQPLVFPAGVTKFVSLMSNCPAFNSSITFLASTIDELSTFLEGAKAFNQPLTFPTISKCGVFMNNCESFNQPITLNVTSSMSASMFKNCNSMTSTITLNCPAPNSWSSDSFSTTDNTAACYTTGITLKGTRRSWFLSKFPNSNSSPYRKLIDGGA